MTNFTSYIALIAIVGLVVLGLWLYGARTRRTTRPSSITGSARQRRVGNSGVTILLATSRTVNDQELNGLLVELLYHLYHEVRDVRAAYERGEFTQESFDKYSFGMTANEIERTAKVLGIRDWGDVRRTQESLGVITDCLARAGIGSRAEDAKRVYGCYLNVVGRAMALPSNTSCTIRDVAFLGLALLNV
jgi:hypothetical protein